MTCIFVFHANFSSSILKNEWQKQRLQAWSAETNLEAPIGGNIIGGMAMTEGMKKGDTQIIPTLQSKSTLLIMLSLLIIR